MDDYELTFMDNSGDTIIKWGSETDAKMRAIIERLLIKEKRGFFAIPIASEGATASRKEIEDLSELVGRSIVVDDLALRALYAEKDIRVVRSTWSTVANNFRRLTSVDEVIEFSRPPTADRPYR